MDTHSLDTELRKLLALNTTNLDISKRLIQHKTDFHNPSHFPVGGSPVTNEQLSYDVLQQVTFSNGQISFHTNTKTVQLPVLTEFFPNTLNIFNDTLPTNTYFDLTGVINKYIMLNPARCNEVIALWKNALEKTQVALGQVESHIIEDLELTKSVYVMFGVKTCTQLSPQQQYYYSPSYQHILTYETMQQLDHFMCTVSIKNEGCLKLLQNILKLVKIVDNE